MSHKFQAFKDFAKRAKALYALLGVGSIASVIAWLCDYKTTVASIDALLAWKYLWLMAFAVFLVCITFCVVIAVAQIEAANQAFLQRSNLQLEPLRKTIGLLVAAVAAHRLLDQFDQAVANEKHAFDRLSALLIGAPRPQVHPDPRFSREALRDADAPGESLAEHWAPLVGLAVAVPVRLTHDEIALLPEVANEGALVADEALAYRECISIRRQRQGLFQRIRERLLQRVGIAQANAERAGA